MIRVRVNRLRCGLIAAIGFPLSVGLVIFDPKNGDPTVDELWRSIGMACLGLSTTCLSILLRRWYFTFDTRGRRMTVEGRWHGTYPGRGFERIEYSVYDGRIYQIRTNGKRRRVPVRRWFAHRRDWDDLVDRMLPGQAELRVAADHRDASTPQ